MNERVDLHLHTTASDGRWTPDQLVAELMRAGIGLFAVTDHDALGSLDRAAELACTNGLRFLSGVELSSRLDGTILHILGYGFEPGDPGLVDLAQANTARLSWENDEAIRLLARAGYPVSVEAYERYEYTRGRGGWKALNYLIDRGVISGVPDYFGRLFGGELVHPSAPFPAPDLVIETIRQAGGCALLAHPGAGFCRHLGEAGLDRLVGWGLQGLECHSLHHDEDTTRTYLDYCRSRDLLVSGGSDCHGGFVGRQLGVPEVHWQDLRLGLLEDRILCNGRPGPDGEA